MIEGVIPVEKVMKVGEYNTGNLDAPYTSKIHEPLGYMSQLGRVINGHIRGGKSYPNTTILDLLEPLEDKGRSIREYISSEIQGVEGILSECIDIYTGKKTNASSILGNRFNDNLSLVGLPSLKTPFGLNIYSEAEIFDVEAFLKGAYIFTQVDKFENRDRVSRLYRDINGNKIEIGGGECHVGNYDAIKELGVKVGSLAKSCDEDLEEILYKYGVLQEYHSFSKSTDSSRDINNQFCLYLKKKDHLGCCDDAMLSTVGRLFLNNGPRAAYSAMIGAALIDTVDTLDKISARPVTFGADEKLGEFIENKYGAIAKKPLVKQELIDIVIYAGAKNNVGHLPFSSSVKKLNKIQNPQRSKKETTALKSHIDFVLTGKVTQGLGLGFTQFDSHRFYHIMENVRWKNMEKIGLLKPL